MPLLPADLAFLQTQRVARLATVDPFGAPHIIPVCFAHVNGHLFIPIDAKPKRIDPRTRTRTLTRLRNLRANPRAALLLDHYAEDWTHLSWLLVRATARILDPHDQTTEAERAAALTALEQRYPQYAAMRLSSLELPVIALDPTTIRRWSAQTT